MKTVFDALCKAAGHILTDDKIIGKVVPEGFSGYEKNRILTFDKDGNFLSNIPQPESDLFGENNVYKPIAVAVDKYDRLFVVSSTTYQGIILMTDTGEFTGFIGAQKSYLSAWDIIWRRFQTDEQKAQSIKVVSTEFNNITIDDGGFVYVTTSSIKESNVLSAIKGKSKSGDYAPVKLLNAGGSEIMRRNGFYPPSGEVDTSKFYRSDSISGASTVVDAAVGPEKTWSIIDSKRSRVFTYDYDGNLLFAFGDTGRQLGNIPDKALRGIVYQDDNMLLLDKQNGSFTVYKRTEYGDILINALKNQNERRYNKAIDDWMEILKRNSNFDSAYIGIGNALFRSGEYKEANKYFIAAYDTTNYSESYKEIRKEWISKYILLIPVIIIAIVISWTKFTKYAKKLNKKVSTSKEKRTYWQELVYVFHVIFHPFDGFWDLKHEKRGSVRAAVTILALTLAAFYYQNVGVGYVMNPRGTYSRPMTVFLGVLVPLFLWVLANWCLTTLFDGEGNIKDIFIACCYALLPLVLTIVPTTIISNFVLVDEVNILNLVVTIGFIWVGILIFFGMMVTHDYSMFKNILTSGGAILGMVVIMFIAILFSTLLGKL